MTKEQALQSGLAPLNGMAAFRRFAEKAQGPISAVVRYIRVGGDIYLRTSVPMVADRTEFCVQCNCYHAKPTWPVEHRTVR